MKISHRLVGICLWSFPLQEGKAADAALVSWTRRFPERSFLFHPRKILLQPGGAERWKDSDIFVEGAEFRKKSEEEAIKSGGMCPAAAISCFCLVDVLAN